MVLDCLLYIAVPQEDFCHDPSFVYLNNLLTAAETSMRMKNAVIYLLTAIINNNGNENLYSPITVVANEKKSKKERKNNKDKYTI